MVEVKKLACLRATIVIFDGLINKSYEGTLTLCSVSGQRVPWASVYSRRQQSLQNLHVFTPLWLIGGLYIRQWRAVHKVTDCELIKRLPIK